MRITLFMSSGFDTFSPSLHLYNALIQDLINSGHRVHLIESHTFGINPDIPDNLIKLEGFTYESINQVKAKKKQFAKRYLAGVKYCFSSIPAFKRQKSADILMIQSCPWAPFAVSFAKWFSNVPVIYNSQDLFPGASIANGAMTQKWMQKFFYNFQRIAYRKADHIIVISEDMKIKVMEQGVNPDKITVIPDWYDDKNVKEIPWEENLFVKKYDLDREHFYVQFAGTMGFNFDYKMVINVAKLLKDRKDIVFHMIGQGSQKEDFIEAVKKEGLDNIIFFPLEPQEMVPHVYSACSVCLIPLPYGVIGNSVPSKAGLLMACHRVIVTSADADSDYNDMFTREKIGISCSSDDPNEVANAILTLRDNPKLRSEYAENAYKYGSTHYTRTINTALYQEVYRKVGAVKE